MAFNVFNILDTDKLRSGFRAKYNATLGQIIKNVTITTAGIQTFISQDDTELELDLGEAFYTKSEVNTLFVVPTATEETAGKLRIATWDEVTAGLSDATAITPYKLAQLLDRDQARYIQASEDIQQYDLVSVFMDAGTLKARKAVATALTTLAVAVAMEAAAAGEELRVRLSGSSVDGYTALTPGTYYYLSTTTPAGFTATPPAGTIRQPIGYALSATELFFQAEEGALFTAAGLGLTDVHKQGGNAFGAASVIGTTDNQPFQVKTNNVTRAAVQSSGEVDLNLVRVSGSTVSAQNNTGIVYVSGGSDANISSGARMGLYGNSSAVSPGVATLRSGGVSGSYVALGFGSTDRLRVDGTNIKALSQIQSTVADGTAPLIVASATVVTNLNSNFLQGFTAADLRNASNLNAGTVPSARLTGSYPNVVAGSAAKWSNYRAILLTGDVAGYGAWDGSDDLSMEVNLVNSGVTADSYGDASHVAAFVVDGQGRLIDATHTAIQIPISAVTGLSTALSGVVSSAGTTNFLLKTTGTGTVGDSQVQDDGTAVTIGGTTGLLSGVKAHIYGGDLVVRDTTASYLKFGSDLTTGAEIAFSNTTILRFLYNDSTEIARFASGNMGIGVDDPIYRLDVLDDIRATGSLISSVETGTPPLYVESTTQVANLNVSALGGYTATDFPRKAEAATITEIWNFAAVPTLAADPVNGNDAVRKSWVLMQAGLGSGIKIGASMVAAYGSNVTLSGAAPASGDYTPANGEPVIVFGQSAPEQNGPYLVNTSGAWSRHPDHNTDANIRNYTHRIVNGSYANTTYANVNQSAITVGTTAIYYQLAFGGESDPTVPDYAKSLDSLTALMGSVAPTRTTRQLAMFSGAPGLANSIISQDVSGGAVYVTGALGITGNFAATGTVAVGTRLNLSASYGTAGQFARSGGSGNTYWGSAALTDITGTTELRKIETLAATGPGVPVRDGSGNWTFLDPGSVGSGTYQPLSAKLTAIADNTTNGVLVYKGGSPSVVPRTLTAVAGQIVITNPEGTADNPLFGLATTGISAGVFNNITTDLFGRIIAIRNLTYLDDLKPLLGPKTAATFSFSTLIAPAEAQFTFYVTLEDGLTSDHTFSTLTISNAVATISSGNLYAYLDTELGVITIAGVSPVPANGQVTFKTIDANGNVGTGVIYVQVVEAGGGGLDDCPMPLVLAELYGKPKISEIGRNGCRFGFTGGPVGSVRVKTYYDAVSSVALPDIKIEAESSTNMVREGTSPDFITLSSATAHYAIYSINISQAGVYRLTIFHACADPANSIRYQVNAGTIVTKTLSNSGGWSAFVTSSESEVTLVAGVNTFKLLGNGSTVHVGYFTLKAPAGSGEAVETLYDSVTVPGNSDRPFVTFSKEHLPGVDYILEIQGETCVSTPDRAGFTVPDDGIIAKTQLLLDDGTTASVLNDITPGGSYPLPVAGFDLRQIFGGVPHTNYVQYLRRKVNGAYSSVFTKPRTDIPAYSYEGSYDLFGSTNNINQASGSAIREGEYRFETEAYDGGVLTKKYSVDFTLTAQNTGGGETFTGSYAEFYNDSDVLTANRLGGQVVISNSPWKLKWRIMNVDYDKIVMRVSYNASSFDSLTQIWEREVTGLSTNLALHREDVFGTGDSSVMTLDDPGYYYMWAFYWKGGVQKSFNVASFHLVAPGNNDWGNIQHAGITTPNGTVDNHVTAKTKNAEYGFNTVGYVTAFSDVANDAALDLYKWGAYNSATEQYENTNSVKEIDRTVRSLTQGGQFGRQMIGLGRAWRDINGRQPGITLFYGDDAMHMREDGTPTYKDNDPSWPVPNESCPSPSHPHVIELAKKLLYRYAKHHLPDLLSGRIKLTLGLDSNAEGQHPFQLKNGFGQVEGYSDGGAFVAYYPKGDFNPYAVAAFKDMFPAHASRSNGEIAGASNTSDLGRDWIIFGQEQLRRLEWTAIDYVLSQIPELVGKRWYFREAGSYADPLSTIRRTFDVQYHCSHPAYALVKSNDNPADSYTSGGETLYNFYKQDFTWSAAINNGILPYQEPSPASGRFEFSIDRMTRECYRATQLGFGISFLSQKRADGTGEDVHQTVATAAGMLPLAAPLTPDSGKIVTRTISLSQIIAQGDSYIANEWLAAGGFYKEPGDSRNRYVHFTVTRDITIPNP